LQKLITLAKSNLHHTQLNLYIILYICTSSRARGAFSKYVKQHPLFLFGSNSSELRDWDLYKNT